MPGFPPIVSSDSRTLILGSYPSLESLRRQQYYAFSRNAFWPILFALYDMEYSDDYEVKKALILEHRLALWDVLYSHDGTSSADQDITNPHINDFEAFFAKYPDISRVFFNGAAAEKLFLTSVPETACPGVLSFMRLPSTSPRNARFSLAQKTELWRVLL